jgi:hypothetical protein
MGARFVVGDGRRARFWLDVWSGDSPLKDRFPLIFAICDDTDVIVAQVLSGTEINLRLCRSLDQVGTAQWLQLCQEVVSVQLSHDKDKVSWSLESSEMYSVSSMYEKL